MAAVWRSQCAFARIFGRKTTQILNNATDYGTSIAPGSQSLQTITKRYSSYGKSPFVHRIRERYDFEIAKNPQEWEFVQRLMPFETVPEVKPKESFPSGWIPPREEAKDLPFFLLRTKNLQVPIYLHLRNRGQTKISKIRRIEGDIWLMNDEIKAYLKSKNNKYIETRVHEVGRFIDVKGDYVNDLLDWAHSKGF